MPYTVKFKKPGAAKTISETFATELLAKKWKRLVKKNGYVLKGDQ